MKNIFFNNSTMNKNVFKTHYKNHSEMAMIIYKKNINFQDMKRTSGELFILVRDVDKYNHYGFHTKTIKNFLDEDEIKEEELIHLQELVKHYFYKNENSKIYFIKNSYITQETSLIDIKSYLSIVISDVLKKEVYSPFLYLESSEDRKPLQNYISGIKQLPLNKDEIEIEIEHAGKVKLELDKV